MEIGVASLGKHLSFQRSHAFLEDGENETAGDDRADTSSAKGFYVELEVGGE